MSAVTPPSSDLLTPDQAAEYLGVKVQTLSVWRLNGRYDLPFVKAGKAVRYRRSDIEKWLASRTATSSSTAFCASGR